MFEFGGGYELLVQDEWLWNYRWRRKLFVGEDGFFEDLLQAVTQSPSSRADEFGNTTLVGVT
jgi:hypothetical protein